MHVIALTTCPDLKHAETLSDIILDRKLAACVSIVPGIRSKYNWKGKRESGDELLLIIKTTSVKRDALEKAVRENHPYELPEFLAIEASGSKGYLDWLTEETGP